MTTDKNPLHEVIGPRYHAVMLVGPPGVGKGTQGKNAGADSRYLPYLKRGYVPRT